jgi:hypothetical protein
MRYYWHLLAVLSFSTGCALPAAGISNTQGVSASPKRKPEVLWGIEGVKDLGKEGKCIAIRGRIIGASYVGQRPNGIGGKEQFSVFLDGGDQVVITKTSNNGFTAVLVGNYSASGPGQPGYFGRTPYSCALTKEQFNELGRLDKAHWQKHGNKAQRDSKYSCLTEKNALKCYLGTLDSRSWIVPKNNRYDATIAKAKGDKRYMRGRETREYYVFLNQKGWNTEDFKNAVLGHVKSTFPVANVSTEPAVNSIWIEGRLRQNANPYFFRYMELANQEQLNYDTVLKSGSPESGHAKKRGYSVAEMRAGKMSTDMPAEDLLPRFPYITFTSEDGSVMEFLGKGYFTLGRDETWETYCSNDGCIKESGWVPWVTALGNFDELRLASRIGYNDAPYMKKNNKGFDIECVNNINPKNLTLDRAFYCNPVEH